ncbi:Protein transport protein yos1 [Lachnellula willkommii]|uniref:Protein transport protein yos1 n=1 Tax=Lachnellula willkommii TaxID=215461 RepID=A0A559MG19_9HELO|nr:Protein transport protein yos1 [Lachnellula willkommii]
MMFFAFGNLIYSTPPLFSPPFPVPTTNSTPVSVLLINAIAVLSEDRFLARVGWSNTVAEPAFGGGGGGGSESVKNRLIGLMTSVRTLMRSRFSILLLVSMGQVGGKGGRGHAAGAGVPLIGINVTIILYELALG